MTPTQHKPRWRLIKRLNLWWKPRTLLPGYTEQDGQVITLKHGPQAGHYIYQRIR